MFLWHRFQNRIANQQFINMAFEIINKLSMHAVAQEDR